MIGILCAMDRELELFLQEIEQPALHRRLCGYDYVQGRLRGVDVVLCRCGVGKVNAAVCTQTMILTWPLKLIVNSGVAGALREEMQVGDVCVAADLVQYDVDTSAVGDPVGFVSTVNQTYFRCADWAAEGVLRAARSLYGDRAYSARIASGDQFIDDQARKERIVRLFDASACEMEGCAIAQVCLISGVDCAVVRAISDASTGSHDVEYRRFMPMAAEISARVVLKFLENL